MKDYNDIVKSYPRKRPDLPESYKKIYEVHYQENRTGKTLVSSVSSKMERWLHIKASKSSALDKDTLEIGAGTLNQLNFESSKVYDIVEPFKLLYKNSDNLNKVTNFFDDISEIPLTKKYDRIISVATFEHIGDLPDVVNKCGKLLLKNGVLCVSIPNEGRFLWKFAYKMTTGIEFKLRYGLNYEKLMNYEHLNTADDIELILKHYFDNVKMSLLGLNKTFSIFRYYECSSPKNLDFFLK